MSLHARATRWSDQSRLFHFKVIEIGDLAAMGSQAGDI
jgi:hypothetical protein